MVYLESKNDKLKMFKIKFANRISKNNDNNCNSLVVYLGNYNKEKWLNSFLRDWNYNQFCERKDHEARHDLENILHNNNYYYVFVEGEGKNRKLYILCGRCR